MTLWDFLNSQFGLLVTGFIFTTIIGSLLSVLFQRASWTRQTRVDLYRKRYEEGTLFLDELSELIGRRFFALQRYFWAIRDRDGHDFEEVKKAYYENVADWNAKLKMNRNKIRLLIGEHQATAFLDYGDDNRPRDPQSLHYIFVKAHNAVVAADKGDIGIGEAEREVDKIDWACSGFLENITTEFLERASALRLLEVPKSDNSAS